MIVLTGASSGIANEILHNLCNLDQVLALYNTNNNIEKIKNKNLIPIKIDLDDEKKIQNLVNKYLINQKKIIVINLASIKIDSLILNQKIEDAEKVFKINYFAPLILAKYITPIMIGNKWGRFIFFSSTFGDNGDLGTSSYTSSKLSLVGLSKILSLEYGKFNITSNVIRLGIFRTGLFSNLSLEKQKELVHMIPSKKTGDFNDIFLTIKLLIEAKSISGAEINIDQGMKK